MIILIKTSKINMFPYICCFMRVKLLLYACETVASLEVCFCNRINKLKFSVVMCYFGDACGQSL